MKGEIGGGVKLGRGKIEFCVRCCIWLHLVASQFDGIRGCPRWVCFAPARGDNFALMDLGHFGTFWDISSVRFAAARIGALGWEWRVGMMCFVFWSGSGLE